MIHLVAVGEEVEPRRLDALAATLSRAFRTACQVREETVDAGGFLQRAVEHARFDYGDAIGRPTRSCTTSRRLWRRSARTWTT